MLDPVVAYDPVTACKELTWVSIEEVNVSILDVKAFNATKLEWEPVAYDDVAATKLFNWVCIDPVNVFSPDTSTAPASNPLKGAHDAESAKVVM